VIELDAVVPIAGVAPVTARLRAGEIVRLTGPAPACAALLDVIAGRRAPRAGAVRRDPRAVPVLVRAGEVAPPGVAPAAAVAAWAALAGAPRMRGGAAVVDAAAALAARGAAVAAPVWLIDGAVPPATAAVVEAAAEAARGGAGAVVWRDDAGRARVDHTIALTASAAAAPPRRRGPTARVVRATPWRAIGALAAHAALAPAAWGLAAVAAAWLALAAWVIAAHQGYWTAAGSGAALVWLARLGAIGAAVIAATATAARARAAPAWPLIVRETGAGAVARIATALAIDVGGAALLAAVAIVPSVWMLDGAGAIAATLAAAVGRGAAPVVAATVAGAVERGPAPAGVGAVAGVVAAVALAAL
jgi:hypothetical protein